MCAIGRVRAGFLIKMRLCSTSLRYSRYFTQILKKIPYKIKEVGDTCAGFLSEIRVCSTSLGYSSYFTQILKKIKDKAGR
jgi:hypothetical protein